MKRALSLLFLLFLAATLSGGQFRILTDPVTGKQVRYAGKLHNSPVFLQKQYVAKESEFRGVWVATIEQIDFKQHMTAASFRKDFLTVLQNLKNAGFTALIFQVRPMNDAFYPSEISPYSKWMTGTEGKTFTDEPAFDPMKYMVTETRKAGLEFHAWLNPYRVANGISVSKKKYLDSLDKKNFARQKQYLVLEYKGSDGKTNLILNPGEPEVMNYLFRVVLEIVQKYQVDAIHMDDYFYPYGGLPEQADKKTYENYGAKKKLTLEEWRRDNVNSLVRNMHILLTRFNQSRKRSVQFGISPFGIWANTPLSVKLHPKNSKKKFQSMPEGSLTAGTQSYFEQYADSRKWVREGWVDYIVPQLYWNFDHDVAAYAALTDWWAKTVRGTKVKLYTGHGFYRLNKGTSWNKDEIPDQLIFNNNFAEVCGCAFFSYIRIFEPDNAVQREAAAKIIKQFWKKQYGVKK